MTERIELLARSMEERIRQALDDGTIDRERVAQLIAGISEDKQAILLWQNEDWEDYDEYAADDAFAEIPNAGWLNAVDALLPTAPPDDDGARTRERGASLQFEHEKLDAAYASLKAHAVSDLKAALKVVGAGGNLGDFEKIVGLMGQGISDSGYADLVAFYHPLGDRMIWPIQERREPSYSGIYQFGVLTDGGVTMFYPEGEGEGLDTDKAPATTKEYRFSEMEFYCPDSDEVTFRPKGDLYDIHLCHGHCHEEWGGPSQEDVDAALIAHFAPHTELLFDDSSMPSPKDAEAHSRWMKLYFKLRKSTASRVVSHAVKNYGPEAARAFIDALPEDDESRLKALPSFADALLAAGNFQASIDIIETLEGKARLREWREELRCLVALGQHDSALATAKTIEEADEKKKNDVAPYRALALSALGRDAEALVVLDAVDEKKRDGRYWWARARALHKSEVAEAQIALNTAFTKNRRLPTQYAEIDFAGCPELLETVAKHQKQDAERKQQSARIEEMSQKVRPPVVPLEADSAFRTALTGGSTQYWNRSEELSYEGEGSLKSTAADDEGRTWVSLKKGGFGLLDLSTPQAPKITRTTACGNSIEDIDVQGHWLYAADWSEGLRVYDLRNEQPKEVALLQVGHGNDSVSVHGSLLALGSDPGAALIDISDPTSPKRLGSVAGGPNHCNGLFLREDVLYMAAGSAGLVIVNVKDPKDPQILASVQCALAEDQLFWSEHVHVQEDGLARLSTSGGRIWLVDVRQPTNPRSLCVLGDGNEELVGWIPTGESVAGYRRYRVVDEDNPILWTIDVSPEELPTIVKADPILDDDKRQVALHYAKQGVLAPDGGITVLCGGEFMPLSPKSLTPVGDTSAIDGAGGSAFTWAVSNLGTYAEEHPNQPVGVLMVSIGYQGLEIALEGPRTIAGVDEGPIARFDESVDPPVCFEKPFNEITGVERAEDEEWNSLVEARNAIEQEAWGNLCRRLAKKLAQTPELAAVAAGRVYVLSRVPTRTGAATTVHDIVTFEDREWEPWRREIHEAQRKSLEEMLSDYGNIDKYTEASKTDEAVREEVFELAAGGLIPALRVTRRLGPDYQDEMIEAHKRAAATARVNDEIVEVLGKHLDRADVRSLLEGMYDAPPEDLAETWRGRSRDRVIVSLAKVLGRSEDDQIVQKVRDLLADEKCSYVEQDMAVEIMTSMSKRLPELLPDLQAHVARCGEHDNRLPALYEQMFRAGYRQLPTNLVAQARREKNGEQYSGMSLGIRFLDENDDHQYDQCRVERLYTGWLVQDRLLELKTKSDTQSSVWPEGLEPEPYPASWKFLMLSILKHLPEEERPTLLDTLCAHAVNKEEYAPDRALLRALFDAYTDTEHVDTLRRIGSAIMESAGYDDKTKRSVRGTLHRVILQRGWEVLKDRDLESARALANELREAEPEDGQIMFFEARLCWLEQDDPNAAKAKAEEYLPMLQGDAAGRGRLLNLIGCTLDVQDRVAEALPFFERAAQTHGEDPIYLANIAECYEKLGNMEEAYKWAKTALQRKAKSELCERIVREHDG